jgi:molybdopterin converting factor subunit 1
VFIRGFLMFSSRRIHIQFFAILREQAGCTLLEVSTAARTARDLYRELQQSHRLELPSTSVQVAINARYATMDTPLQTGDHVVFIPPVAGG